MPLAADATIKLVNRRALATAAAVVLVLALGAALLYAVRAQTPQVAVVPSSNPAPSATVAASPLTATPTRIASTPAPAATSPTVVAVACGPVAAYASDDATMLLTLKSGSTTTQYFLEYQFASVRPPTDIGDRLSAKTEQLIQTYGRQVPPSTGTPDAMRLRDFTATRVTSCSATLSVAPAAFTGFVPPQGCTYVGGPVLGVDGSDRFVDCGASGNRDARGTLAPAFTQQGWTSCGSGLGTAAWTKGATGIGIAESSGSPGDFPKLTQFSRTAFGSCP